MRVSDYVMQYLEKMKVEHIFMLSGGGIMYLVDSLGRSNIEYVCCHHEQAAGIAAQAYAMQKNELGVCLITTGPGGTNVLTAAGAAYVDSTPMLFITGQVKTSDFASLRGVRQFGAQENDIVSMAKPVTKYAVTVMKAEEIRFHLEKAIYLALHGRQGPVWLDIPLDIQNAEIDVDSLIRFDPTVIEDKDIQAQLKPKTVEIARVVDKTIELLKNSRKPLFILGHGVNASGAKEAFYKIQNKIKIPVLSTWRALDVLDYEDEYFFGSPGLQANRYSNIITQGADFVIILGSRLDNMITAFSEERFAYRAKDKIIVDIDENEVKKLNMPGVIPAICDVKYFLEQLYDKVEKEVLPEYSQWLEFCQSMKQQYPLLKEKQLVETNMADLYRVSMRLSEECRQEDSIVVSSTSRCNTAGHMAFKHKKGQKTISSMGFGSMGFALPSVVGSWFGNNKRRVIMIEGDGSLQLNLQEMQTIVHHKIEAKMFVFHNAGYAAIATMQDRNFEGFHVGSDEESGVSMPDLRKIADAYGIPYFRIDNNSEIEEVILKAMSLQGAVICEFVGAITYDEIPKCISSLNAEGKRVSAALENPYPFLSKEEMERIYSRL